MGAAFGGGVVLGHSRHVPITGSSNNHQPWGVIGLDPSKTHLSDECKTALEQTEADLGDDGEGTGHDRECGDSNMLCKLTIGDHKGSKCFPTVCSADNIEKGL